MTALTAGEAEVIARGRQILSRALSGDFPWPPYRCGSIAACRHGLEQDLADYDGLLDGSRHPASVYDDLGRHQDDALAVAVERIVQDVADWAGALVLAVREHCGEQAAEWVAGGTREMGEAA